MIIPKDTHTHIHINFIIYYTQKDVKPSHQIRQVMEGKEDREEGRVGGEERRKGRRVGGMEGVTLSTFLPFFFLLSREGVGQPISVHCSL